MSIETTTHSGRPRRRQVDRSSETRALLTRAAIDLLQSVGFVGTTTAAIARRAGVTTGALHHHFATKDDLLFSVLEESARHISGLLSERERGRPGARLDVRELIGHLWKVYGDPAYWAVWEVIIGTRADGAFHARVVAHRRETMGRVVAPWVCLHVPCEQDHPQATALFEFMLVAIRGLSLERFLHQDSAYFERHLDILADTIRPNLEPLIAGPETRERVRPTQTRGTS